MKTAILLLILSCYFQPVSGQGIVAQPDKKVLFRGYANVLQIGLNGVENITVTGKNCTVKTTGVNRYVVTPGKASTATILLLNSLKDTLANETYKVLTLPPLKLSWNGLLNGAEVLDRSSNKLSLSYGPGIPLQGPQKIVAYSIQVSGNPKVIKGTGNLLSAECRALIQDAVAGQTMTITATYKTTTQETKTISAIFSLQ
jgi:hypothetical protein